MKVFKLIDLGIQLLIVIAWLVYNIYMQRDGMSLISVYFFLGGFQLLSFFVHMLLKENWIGRKDRNSYGKTILWLLVIGLISYSAILLEIPLLFFYLFALLIISPPLAVWYFIIGVKEFGRIRHQDLTNMN